jgi:hypothetical protein
VAGVAVGDGRLCCSSAQLDGAFVSVLRSGVVQDDDRGLSDGPPTRVGRATEIYKDNDAKERGFLNGRIHERRSKGTKDAPGVYRRA